MKNKFTTQSEHFDYYIKLQEGEFELSDINPIFPPDFIPQGELFSGDPGANIQANINYHSHIEVYVKDGNTGVNVLFDFGKSEDSRRQVFVGKRQILPIPYKNKPNIRKGDCYISFNRLNDGGHCIVKFRLFTPEADN